MTIRIARAFGASDEPFTLSPGDHKTPEEGLCAMEAAAWLAGLPHSDRPDCTSEIIAAYVRHLNDHMPDKERGRLVAYLPEIIGIPSDDWDHIRNELLHGMPCICSRPPPYGTWVMKSMRVRWKISAASGRQRRLPRLLKENCIPLAAT